MSLAKYKRKTLAQKIEEQAAEKKEVSEKEVTKNVKKHKGRSK